jgi:hypothetical protein
MESWKTTLAGVGMLLSAVSIIIAGISGGVEIDFAAAGAALMGGIGLLLARDNDKPPD